MVFYFSLSDSKSPQVSGTLLSILADLNNASCSLDGLHYSSYFQVLQSQYQSFGDCAVSFMFHCFFQFSSKVLVLISLFASFLSCDQSERQSPLFGRFSFVVVVVVVIVDYYDYYYCYYYYYIREINCFKKTDYSIKITQQELTCRKSNEVSN